MTDTFTWAVDLAGASEALEYPVNALSFGDGYEQRAPKGLAPAKRSWQVQRTADAATSAAIEAFLDRHQGVTSFHWRPHPDDDLMTVIVRQRNKQPLGKGYVILSWTFEEVR